MVRYASGRPLPHPANPDRLVPCADHTESADRARCIGTAPGEFPFRQFLPLLHSIRGNLPTITPRDSLSLPVWATLMTQTRKKSTSSRLQTPLETYLREINETALLTADDEKMLSNRISGGDAAARDRMVRANLRLVVNIARGYSGKGLPLQDLIEEGNLGLLRAVEGFDPTMNTRFSTYASYWIKQSIKRALVNSAKTIRIPAYMVELLSKWRRTSAELTDKLNRTPTPEEIAAVLEIPRKKLRIVKKAITLYNATPQTDSDEGGLTLGDIIPDERIRGPQDELINTDNLNHVTRLLEEMEPREATILKMRFGIDEHEPQTLKEIGETLGLTRERVRQIEAEALRRLHRSIDGEK